MKTNAPTFRKSLASALVEKDVENAYRSALADARPDATISSPHGCDGLLAWGDVRLLLECKLDVDMKARADVARVLAQVVSYVQRFAAAGEPLPNVLMLADRNECCVLPLAALQGYLADAFDWSLAPSSPDPRLVTAIAATLNFVPHVFDVGPRFGIDAVTEATETLARGATHTIRATLANVGTIFGYWREHVFKGKLGPVDQVDVFLRCLFDAADVYLHPKRKGTLVVPGYADGVQVHADRYVAFFDTFAQGYKPSEIEAFYAAKDRLIDDDARRRQGAFFTPRIWVDEAHRTIESVLGPAWRDECIVWDPACGTDNLCRDYVFADLILSTAERSDVETIKAQGYNPGASVFQYDFLNPDAPSPFFPEGDRSTIPPHVDAQLRAAAKAGKRLVFLMNPPYGTASVNGPASRAGMAITSVNTHMKQSKLGACSAQLYAQFMHRAAELACTYSFTNHTIALFSGVSFMTSASFTKFRQRWYSNFVFLGGFMFQASHFANVAASWAIAFTLWNKGVTSTVQVRLKDCADFGTIDLGTKVLRFTEDDAASHWVCVPAITEQAPGFSSGLVRAKTDGKASGLCHFVNDGNTPQNSATNSSFMPTGGRAGNNRIVYVLPANFRRCTALFAARKLVTGTWINDKDEYLAPDETAPGYAQWNDDAHVYALMHPSNNCTAMRNVAYKNRNWTISNHLFWLTRAEALAALDTSDTPALYRDCKSTPAGYVVPKSDDAPREQWEIDGDPYLAHVLPSLDLSPEARDVLDRLRALWLRSLPLREAFAAERPELHLLAWDAGVYQLKHLWREHFAADWEALREAHRKLADRMRPGVYDFGFLLR